MSDLKEAIVKNIFDFQLAPPHIHCRKSVEQAIMTFNNHSISGFSTTYLDFPVSGWDLLLPQATNIINFLLNTRVDSQPPYYYFVFGTYEFNKNSMAPPGAKVVDHDNPTQCTSWGHHGTPSWFVGLDLYHYSIMKYHML